MQRLFVDKWYYDELVDVTVVRPFAWFGRFGQQTFERLFVNGALIGGTTGDRSRRVGRGPGRPVRLPALLRRAAGPRDGRADPTS